MKIRTMSYLLLLALFCWPMPVLAATATSPSQTVANIGAAIDNADIEAFERLVDVDAMLNDSLNVFLREMRKPENSSRMSPMLAIMFSQAGAGGPGGEKLRQLLKEEGKAFVHNGINSGAFAGKKLASSRQAGILAPLFADASIGRKEITYIEQPKKDGEAWLVPFTVRDYGNDQDYRLVGRLSPTVNGWRLTSLQNLDQIFRQILEESQAR